MDAEGGGLGGHSQSGGSTATAPGGDKSHSERSGRKRSGAAATGSANAVRHAGSGDDAGEDEDEDEDEDGLEVSMGAVDGDGVAGGVNDANGGDRKGTDAVGCLFPKG